jgi:hypothetical protein
MKVPSLKQLRAEKERGRNEKRVNIVNETASIPD